jgi:hypothetical protein
LISFAHVWKIGGLMSSAFGLSKVIIAGNTGGARLVAEPVLAIAVVVIGAGAVARMTAVPLLVGQLGNFVLLRLVVPTRNFLEPGVWYFVRTPHDTAQD